MVLGDINVYMEGNSMYSLKTKNIHIYNGIITDRVIKTKIVGSYQISVTSSGSVYVTVPTTITTAEYEVEVKEEGAFKILKELKCFFEHHLLPSVHSQK